MLTIVVFGGLSLVLLVTACIVADIVAGVRRRSDGVEKTAGRVTRVRGPVSGQLESGATAECLEITVEYYTRHGEGPFQVQRMIPLTSASSYTKNDRVIVSYDVRAPRRARIAGRVSHWPQLVRRVGGSVALPAPRHAPRGSGETATMEKHRGRSSATTRHAPEHRYR